MESVFRQKIFLEYLKKGLPDIMEEQIRESTGIGLYLCKKIMDKMGHKIWIDSEVGKGTRVYLELTRKEWNRITIRQKRKTLQECKIKQGKCHMLRWQDISSFL